MTEKFGLNQISLATPSWAKWFFRIVFLVTKVIIGYVAATNLIDPNTKYELTLFLSLVVDPLAFGFSKMFGINFEDELKKTDVSADDIGGGVGKIDPPKGS